ncbi:MCE family protein [Bailinhaonella thermotolerans]|uniref:MCE family protein n=1 Tax=Bailinhaonella thermotolerans TaxID=1070861 RepID=A0A3A4AYW3_9ACTN|nr:MlaD family protein [Bailinhaonella thermotolerans]RJL34313.1 MCE family protein [Bailinhaonella thermotolerans]
MAVSDRVRRRRTLVRLALFTAATAGLIALIAAQLAAIELGGGTTVTAVFDDVSGLRAGDEVKIAGAPAGQVDEIEVVNGRAEVTFTLRDPIKVPSDSEAAVRWRNAIGQRVIYVLPGKAATMMRDGARITRTRSVVDIGEVINDLAPLTRSIDPQEVNELLRVVAQSLDGNEENVDLLIRNLDKITGSLAERRQTIRQLVGDYEKVTTLLARRDQQISRMVDALVDVTGAYADNRKVLDDTIVQLSAVINTQEKVLGQNADEFGRLLGHLSALTGGIRRNTGTLENTLETIGPLLRRAYASTNRGDFVVAYVGCLTLGPSPCPYGMNLPGKLPGAGRLTSAKAMRSVMVGD